ncbi:Rrf2 family transcriptional regulator [Marivirga sp.]|uniref:RrF2 family transcriptional regulator n=1 Tax=Marivirga sp. TaxID=2018662 RepID=UPI002D7FE859|nr:Rrf2 family transcriptional regulator [Marivirga sp.]HET8860952.1 Rrf2 family transcriptional regulator [Marivirga sp.]
MFSKSCEYGIRAVIFIATQSKKTDRVKIGDIAEKIDSPVAFTAKILGLLVRNKIVSSITGPKGGFYIEPHRLDKIFLKDIVEVIDGDKIYKGCGLGLKECSASHSCPVHHKFAKVRAEIDYMLSSTTLKELTEGLHEKLTFLMR